MRRSVVLGIAVVATAGCVAFLAPYGGGEA